jgi:hypothetical protein
MLRRKNEELERLHRSNQDLREGLKQALMAITNQQEHVKELEGLITSQQERIKTLEGQLAKDSHNSSLPPSSDRFVRAPKSLRQKSGKKPGGQKQSGKESGRIEGKEEESHPCALKTSLASFNGAGRGREWCRMRAW